MSYAALSCPIPRRFRRPLLFPPGLLALAWLLCLGCVALPRMPGLQPQYVLTTVLPAYNQCNLPLEFEVDHQTPPWCFSKQELESFRQWQTIDLLGTQWSDYFNYQLANLIVQGYKASPNQDAGLRIRMSDKAIYAQVVGLLDWVSSTNHKKYWLDIQHTPVTLYAITNRPSLQAKPRPAALLGLFSCTDVYIPTAPSVVNTDLLSRLNEMFFSVLSSPLLSPAGRNTLLLLLLLGLLSGWRLRRQWRRAVA
jgi:hypothetical protein